MARIIDYWEGGDIVVLVSPAIIDELAEVVQRPRLRDQMTVDPRLLIDLVLSDAIQTVGELSYPGASRDPKDDKFLACAVEGKASYVVSGDTDLLALKEFHEVLIIRPVDLVDMIQALKNTEGA